MSEPKSQIVRRPCGCNLLIHAHSRVCQHDVEKIHMEYNKLPRYPNGKTVIGAMDWIAKHYDISKALVMSIGRGSTTTGGIVYTDEEVERINKRAAAKAALIARREARAKQIEERRRIRAEQVAAEQARKATRLHSVVESTPGAVNRLQAAIRKPRVRIIDPGYIPPERSTNGTIPSAHDFERFLGMVTDGFIGLLATLESLRPKTHA